MSLWGFVSEVLQGPSPMLEHARLLSALLAAAIFVFPVSFWLCAQCFVILRSTIDRCSPFELEGHGGTSTRS